MARIGDVTAMRKAFWGDHVTGNPPTQSQRAIELVKLLVDSYNPVDKEFYFKIGNSHRVCERGFLLSLGIYYILIK
jgi:hypothetical protein